MILAILLIKDDVSHDDDNDKDDDIECIETDSAKGREMIFSARAKSVIIKSKWILNNEIGKECICNKKVLIE